ncbi:hypothetical protein HYDPIDRAFT_108890 [Hydnomerulius pinastri MD-312]|nr:hypothetical protein HYDPIDRAFT_108890 [Hydnomerulius pinastri MD-312]
MPIREVLDYFNQYVYNKMPTHVVYIPEMKLVSRDDVKRIYKGRIEALTQKDIEHQANCSSWKKQSRQFVIREMVENIVKYAIFSHRWLDEGEPTFQEMSGGIGGRGPGYDKLTKFCEKAKKHGCDLAWSDTCCIDKSSSAELEEAIRSMFRWYRNAHVCIAYLAQTTSVEDFRSEVWFTRGWTLQELLAPEKMKFYGKEWTALGNSANDKDDRTIMNALEWATEIPMEDLQWFSPGTRRVREKMAWASKRQTTRIEDIAYSLIGIFDVNMPVAYGEGEWAFHHLMEVIVQRCVEWEVFAWAGPSSPYSARYAIPESPACFTMVNKDRAKQDQASSFIPAPEVVSTRSRGDPSFKMTKHGLKLKVLIVKLDAPAYDYRGICDCTVDFFKFIPQQPKNKSKTFEDVTVQCFSGVFSEVYWWALGIVDYWYPEGSTEGILDPGQECLGLLLRKFPGNEHGQWEKVRTEQVIAVRCLKEVRRTPETIWL